MKDKFFQRVYGLLAKIPPGRVVTYGDLACHLGWPGGARAVGWAMRHCPDELPWHRVVNARGQVSTTSRLPGGKPLQQAMLEEEGVLFDAAGRLDLDAYAWAMVDDE